MNTVEAFKTALKGSNTSELEMSWNLKMQEMDFKALMAGEMQPSQEQENLMLKFIFKNSLIIHNSHIGNNGDRYEIRVNKIDPLI